MTPEEKVEARRKDEDDISSGRRTREQVADENGLFSCVRDRIRVRIRDAKPLR